MEIITQTTPLQSESDLRGVTGVVRYLAQFNKISGEFITLHVWHENNALETLYSKYLEVEFDPSLYTHVGNYDNFTIILIADAPVVITEEGMDAEAAEAIDAAYSTGSQLNILQASVERIAAAIGVDLPELAEMKATIAEILRKNQLRKDNYAASPEHIYISDEDAAASLSRQMEGGRHEAIGPNIDNGF